MIFLAGWLIQAHTLVKKPNREADFFGGRELATPFPINVSQNRQCVNH